MAEKRYFLVNRSVGKNIPYDNNDGNFPSSNFFQNENFLEVGQIIELVEIEEIEKKYFGIMFREDKMTVLKRGKLESFGLELLN